MTQLAYGQTAPSPLPSPTGYVNDYANVIDSASRARMEAILRNLRDRAKIDFAIVTVPTTGDRDIFDYSLSVARGWGIGAPDDERKGLLLLVAVNDRKYFTQVSRHLEGDLPDGLVGEIGRQMRAPFRAGDYSQGIMNAVQTFVATMAEKQGFSIEGIDQRYAYRGGRQSGRGTGGVSSGGSGLICCIGIALLFLLIAMLNRRGGGGGGGGGLMNALLLGTLFNSMSQRSYGSSGWGGGTGGGDSGGGGDSFGGFGGGGGDFGGGGAGGDW